MARTKLGAGEVFLLSNPEAFENRALGREDHLELILRLAPAGRPVYFDEFVHGLQGQAGFTEVLRHWGLGPFLAFAVLGWIVHLWRRRSRLGPAEDDFRETRIEAVDFVDSLALLYDRTLQRRQALALYWRALEREAAIRTRLKGPALEAHLQTLVERPLAFRRPGRNDVSVHDFHEDLKALNDAFRRQDDAKRAGNRRAGSAARGTA